MASYAFLYDRAADQAFIERCAVAVTVLADTILNDGAATAPEKAWAYRAFANAKSEGKVAARIVLAANKDADEATINAATNATIQTNVDSAKAVLVAGNV